LSWSIICSDLLNIYKIRQIEVKGSFMKKLQALALLVTLVCTSQSFGGNSSGGGGDGHVASFIGVARNVGEWLKKNGRNLNPPQDGDRFLKFVDPKKIHSQNQSLYYLGFEVDAKYSRTRDLIMMNRGRWDSDTEDEQWKTACHEIGRRMGIEGDGYEYCWQVVKAAASDGTICKNAFCRPEALSYPPNANILMLKAEHIASAGMTPEDSHNYSYIGPFAPAREVLAERSKNWADHWADNPAEYCGILQWNGGLNLKPGAQFTAVQDVVVGKTKCGVEKIQRYYAEIASWDLHCDTPVSGTCIVPIDAVIPQGLMFTLKNK
jgi:hypothetical protein